MSSWVFLLFIHLLTENLDKKSGKHDKLYISEYSDRCIRSKIEKVPRVESREKKTRQVRQFGLNNWRA